MIQRFALVVLFGAAMLPAQQESPVVGVGPFLHIVSDLDQSVEFYHGKLGLELSRPLSDQFTDDPAIANLYGVPGRKFRAAVLKIPGSEMGIELVQWGEARRPVAGKGRVALVLHDGRQHGRVLDPDGFPVESERSENPGANINVDVNDGRKSAALYETVLALKSDRIRFTKATGKSGLDAGFPTPGQGMLRLFVRNIAALTASLKSAGFSVITTGGAPVTLPQGQRVIILRDPNNFYLQLMESPQK